MLRGGKKGNLKKGCWGKVGDRGKSGLSPQGHNMKIEGDADSLKGDDGSF